MRIGEDAAEVRVALAALTEERHVAAALERHLGAGDRPDAEVLRGMCELEGAVDAVVVGERERVVAELGGARGELLGQRRAVEERVGGVRVQLDVGRGAGLVPGTRRAPGTALTSPTPPRAGNASFEMLKLIESPHAGRDPQRPR